MSIKFKVKKMLDKKVGLGNLEKLFKDLIIDKLREYTTNEYHQLKKDEFRKEFIKDLKDELEAYPYYSDFYCDMNQLINKIDLIAVDTTDIKFIHELINKNCNDFMLNYLNDIIDILDDIFKLWYASYIPDGMKVDYNCKRSIANVDYIIYKLMNKGLKASVYHDYNGLSVDTVDELNDDIIDILHSVKPVSIK